MVSINSYMMKRINRKKVLEALRSRSEGITKQELAELTGLTIASIGNILNDLERINLIRTAGYGESRGGRKPVLYQFHADAFFVLGLSIGVGRSMMVLTNLDGKILSSASLRFSEAEEPEVVLRRLAEKLQEVIQVSGVDPDRLIGLGISAPGPLDPETGVILSPPNLPRWKSVEVCRFFEETLKLPAFLEKDANAAALCELWYGQGKNHDNLLYVMIDAGIGSGIIIDGKIYRGKSNVSGEIGHGTIDIDGPRCNCGNYGCLEVMASGTAVVRRAKEEIKRGYATVLESSFEELELSHVLEGYRQGDELCLMLVQESSRYVGIALADKINFLNPELVILGGELPGGVPPYFEWVQQVAMRRIFQETAMGVQFARSTYGPLSEALGATTSVVENLFRLPRLDI